MKYKSAMTTQASGSVDGMTASHNRFGRYMRSRAIPVNPSSGRQVTVRDSFGSLSSLWRSLTQAQHDAWADYAANTPRVDALGDSIILTGLQWYVAMNTLRMQADVVFSATLTPLGVIDDAPTTYGMDDPGMPVASAAGAGANTVSMSFDNTVGWANEDGGVLLVYAGRQVGAGVNFYAGPYRLAAFVEGSSTVAPTSPEVVAYSTITSWSPLAQGNKVSMRALSLRADGRISPSFRSIITVGA